MKKIFCDVPNCKEKAHKEDLITCRGYLTSTSSIKHFSIEYLPFESPKLEKMDLCKKHFRMWCKSTYELFFEIK